MEQCHENEKLDVSHRHLADTCHETLKIIYVHQYFNIPSMPGGSRTYEMARRLVAHGHEVHVVTSDRSAVVGRKGWHQTQEDGIHVHWFHVPYHNNMSYRQRLSAFVRFAIAASKKARCLGGDVVLATSTPLTIAIPGIHASRGNKIPMIFEVRDLWPEMPIAVGAIRHPLLIFLARWLERYAYRHANRVIALSPGMADGVVATGYPRHQVEVIPNSCDLDTFMPSEVSAQRFRRIHPELGEAPIVLYAGALGRVNGVGYLVEVAEHLRARRPDVRFVIMGEGAEADRIRDLAAMKGLLNTSVFFYPRVAHAKICDAFSAASVVTSLFVDIPAMQNNSANKFFDGLASGTGVAINYEGWQADLLLESGAGLVLSRDTRIAARQLQRWLENEVGKLAAGRAARRLAEEQFSRDLLAARLERALVSVVEEGRIQPCIKTESRLS
ncbi:glycosyltransferase family 4 protein [Halomonas sp. LR5S13]|uniref:glycosyltransferase family 4 protein n=1 Tax=Halomonas rhizosphaerae TaxID=3043296 RepID=UPI0024A8DAF8|nr:glycosyltransferase family 4 protein [Halomonas rhizosphaerae]MDI5920854.1 glycosyltransferase family 4 protein [Halomonas rhizosphaerae]